MRESGYGIIFAMLQIVYKGLCCTGRSWIDNLLDKGIECRNRAHFNLVPEDLIKGNFLCKGILIESALAFL